MTPVARQHFCSTSCHPPSASLTFLLAPHTAILLANPHERGSYFICCRRTITHCLPTAADDERWGVTRMILVSRIMGLTTSRILHKANQSTRRRGGALMSYQAQETPVAHRCLVALLAFDTSMGRTSDLPSYSFRRRS